MRNPSYFAADNVIISCNHSQGHSKEGGYDKPNNRVDDLFANFAETVRTKPISSRSVSARAAVRH